MRGSKSYRHRRCSVEIAIKTLRHVKERRIDSSFSIQSCPFRCSKAKLFPRESWQPPSVLCYPIIQVIVRSDRPSFPCKMSVKVSGKGRRFSRKCPASTRESRVHCLPHPSVPRPLGSSSWLSPSPNATYVCCYLLAVASNYSTAFPNTNTPCRRNVASNRIV